MNGLVAVVRADFEIESGASGKVQPRAKAPLEENHSLQELTFDTVPERRLPKLNVVEVASSNGQLKMLLQAVYASGLLEDLRGKGPFTMLAPTDEAFGRLPAGALAELLAPKNKNKLIDVLKYHIFPGRYSLLAIEKMGALNAINGQTVRGVTEKDQFKLNGARVISQDIQASNGVIHVIDKVLMPVSDTVLMRIKADGRFRTFYRALKATGLDQKLSGDQPVTVLAPTDKAFSNLSPSVINYLFGPKNQYRLKYYISYHLLSSRQTSGMLRQTNRLISSSKLLPFNAIDNQLYAGVRGAKIINRDLNCRNGNIHVIDKVLIPYPVRINQFVRETAPIQVIRGAINASTKEFASGNIRTCVAIYHLTTDALLISTMNAKYIQILKKTRLAVRSEANVVAQAFIYRQGFEAILAMDMKMKNLKKMKMLKSDELTINLRN